MYPILRSYFFFRQGEKRRRCLSIDEYFQHEQTEFVNRLRMGCLKEKEQVKWVDPIFPVSRLEIHILVVSDDKRHRLARRPADIDFKTLDLKYQFQILI